MEYNLTAPGQPANELWQEKTVYVLSGGFTIVGFDKFAASGFLPKGIPISYDWVKREATAIKGAVLTEALAVDGVAAKVKKGSLFVAGDFIGNTTLATTVVSVDKSNGAYDLITLAGAIGVVSLGGTLLSATAIGAGKVLTAMGLNYADVKYSAAGTCTVIIQAYEVKNSFLPYPLTATQQAELTDRFLVVA